MSKWVLAVLVGVLAFASAAQAQIVLPLTRQGADPRFGGGLYGGGLLGGYGYNPYGYGYNPYGGVGQPYVNPYYNPALQGQGAYGPVTQPQQTGTALSMARQAGAGLADPGSPSITGHPTRFAAYAGYFNSQGGGSTTSATVPSRIPPTATPTGGLAGVQSGVQPQRTGTGMTAPSQTPRR
jgi:hypothetical protein